MPFAKYQGRLPDKRTRSGKQIAETRRDGPGGRWYAKTPGSRKRRKYTHTLSDDEYRWLGWLCTYYGENQSRMMGLLIRAERRRVARKEDLIDDPV